MDKPKRFVHIYSVLSMRTILARSISSKRCNFLQLFAFKCYLDNFREFLMAINITAKGNPEKKLKWAFKMYDIDSNGSIDRQEMLKIIEVIRTRANKSTD